MNQKGQALIVGIIIGLLIAAGLFGIYYLTMIKNSQSQVQNPIITSHTVPPTAFPTAFASSDPTANWKTYSNPQYKYQLKYPPTWQLQEDSVEYVSLYPPEVNLEEALKNPRAMILATAPSIYIHVQSGPLSTYPTGNITHEGIPMITDWKTVVVNGVNGIYYQTHQCAPQCSANTVLPLDEQKTIVIDISTVGQEQGYVPIYNQLVSTLKLTN